MLKKTVSRDERLTQLSVHACLLYVFSIPHLDIEGRMDGLPVAVRGTVVPYIARASADAWTDELVERYMTEWTSTVDADRHERPLVLWYCVKGVWVCEFTGFRDNQRLRADREAPSRFPAPPEDLLSPITPHSAAAGDADRHPDATPGHVADPLFALPDAEPATTYKPDPGEIPGQAEAEVQVQQPPEQRHSVARAREATGAALPDHTKVEPTSDDFAAQVEQRVERRERGFATHGPLGRLLEVLPDADPNTPKVLREVFDPLGPAAIEHARREILELGSSVRKPSAYALGIGRRFARQAAAAR